MTDETAIREQRSRRRRERPLPLVDTGRGKGGSTAALGRMLRGRAQGWPTGISRLVARDGCAEVRPRIADESYRLLVRASSTDVMRIGWVEVAGVVDVLLDRPGSPHAVGTGRDAPRGQKGIEW